MKINSKEAKELLEKERINQKNDAWIGHSICVGNAAGRIQLQHSQRLRICKPIASMVQQGHGRVREYARILVH